MRSLAFISVALSLLLALAQDGGILGPTTSLQALGYSCDLSKCQLPNCNCASATPPGGLQPVSQTRPSLSLGLGLYLPDVPMIITDTLYLDLSRTSPSSSYSLPMMPSNPTLWIRSTNSSPNAKIQMGAQSK